MKLIRYTYPQSQASRAFNRLFELGAPNMERAGSIFDDIFGGEAGIKAPAVDLYEDEHNSYACFEIPGIPKDKVDLEMENAVLTIRGRDSGDESAEVSHNRFERSIRVPEDVDPEKVSASMQDGVLTVTMPKAEKRKPKQITVE